MRIEVVNPICIFHLDSPITGEQVWEWILRPYVSILDLSRLDAAITSKSIRKAFYQSFSHDNPDYNSSGSIHPLFSGLSWRIGESFHISSTLMAKWFQRHRLQLEGISLNMPYNRIYDVQYEEMKYASLLKHLTLMFPEGELLSEIAGLLIPAFAHLEVLHSHYISLSTIHLLRDHCPKLSRLSGRAPPDAMLTIDGILSNLPNISILQLCTTYTDMTSNNRSYPKIRAFHYPTGYDIADYEHKKISASNLQCIVHMFPNLEILSFADVIFTADSNLEFLRTSYRPLLPKLTTLTLRDGVHGNGIDFLCQSMPNLKSLEIDAACIRMKELILSFSICTNLTSLLLKQYYEPEMMGEFLSTALTKCSKLQSLTIDTMKFPSINPNIRCQLQELMIRNCRFNEDLSGWMSSSRSLRKVTIYESYLMAADVEQLAAGISLKGGQVVLDDNEGIVEEDILPLRKKYSLLRFIWVTY
jgi:hypothetical protein